MNDKAKTTAILIMLGAIPGIITLGSFFLVVSILSITQPTGELNDNQLKMKNDMLEIGLKDARNEANSRCRPRDLTEAEKRLIDKVYEQQKQIAALKEALSKANK